MFGPGILFFPSLLPQCARFAMHPTMEAHRQIAFDIARRRHSDNAPLGIELWRLLVAEVLHETALQPWCNGTRAWLRLSYVLLKANQCHSMGAASAVNPIPLTFLEELRSQNPM